jgi:hypothetical protein
VKSLLCVFLIFFLCSCTKEKSLRTLFPKLKWETSFQNTSIVVDKEFQEKTLSGVKMKFTGNMAKHQLIVEETTEVDSDQAAKMFKNKTFMIKGLYSIQATPYTGAVTKEASCMADLQIDPLPVENKIQTALLFNLKATERLVLGVCTEDQNVYRNQTLMLYCKNSRTFYDIRYYYPKEGKIITSSIASCVN